MKERRDLTRVKSLSKIEKKKTEKRIWHPQQKNINSHLHTASLQSISNRVGTDYGTQVNRRGVNFNHTLSGE